MWDGDGFFYFYFFIFSLEDGGYLFEEMSQRLAIPVT